MRSNDIHVKLSPGLPRPEQNSKRRNSCDKKIWFIWEGNNMVHLQRTFLWCQKLDPSEIRL